MAKYAHKDLIQVIITFKEKSEWRLAPIKSISEQTLDWLERVAHADFQDVHAVSMAEWVIDRDQIFWLHNPQTLPKGAKIVRLIHICIPER